MEDRFLQPQGRLGSATPRNAALWKRIDGFSCSTVSDLICTKDETPNPGLFRGEDGAKDWGSAYKVVLRAAQSFDCGTVAMWKSSTYVRFGSGS
jgi:hypothetical protein